MAKCGCGTDLELFPRFIGEYFFFNLRCPNSDEDSLIGLCLTKTKGNLEGV